MGLRLILTRHAKSSWGDPLLEDVDRSLNTRGQRDAVLIAQWLVAQQYMPDQALISAARRTQEAWSLIEGSAQITAAETTVYEGLYLASSDQILRHLRQANAPTVILVAHNPGIGDFAARFATKASPHVDFAQYPTCATTVFEVDANAWSDVRFGANPILDFCVPRDLRP
jgi:phosphohistidine phosphatase